MVTNFIIWQLKLMNCARNLKLSLVTSFWRNTEIWRHISVLWISDSLECWRFLDVTKVILKSNFHQNYSFFRQNIKLNSYLGTFLLKYQNFSETSIPLPIPFKGHLGFLSLLLCLLLLLFFSLLLCLLFLLFFLPSSSISWLLSQTFILQLLFSFLPFSNHSYIFFIVLNGLPAPALGFGRKSHKFIHSF